MQEISSEIVSPCVSQCCLDEDDVCMGCLRHIDEITGWHTMPDEGKRQLLRVLEQRRQMAPDYKRWEK